MSDTIVAKHGRRHGFAAIASSASVLAISFTFFGYALTRGASLPQSGYNLNATFLSSNGLHSGADVVLAGVQVGTVTSINLDERSMLSHVVFSVQQNLQLPVDTRLSIGSSTLTSGNALIVTPGVSHQRLATGAVITQTCELTSLEQQISQYIFGAGGTSSGCGS